jgi:hypothetical protein
MTATITPHTAGASGEVPCLYDAGDIGDHQNEGRNELEFHEQHHVSTVMSVRIVMNAPPI